jgi:hypothetical protein
MSRWSVFATCRTLSLPVAGLTLAASWACAGTVRNPDGPGVSVPHEIAAGTNKKAVLSDTPGGDAAGTTDGAPTPAGTATTETEAKAGAVTGSAGATPESPAPLARGYAPDPEPLRLGEQWDYTLTYRNGDVQVDGAKAITLEAPVVTGRRMGRFAIELWVGAELVERVRFDFPLLGAEPVPDATKDGRRPMKDPPRFQVDATVDVRVPASPRATRAVLVDRATGKTTSLPWPPDAPIADPGQGAGPEPGKSGDEKPGPPPESL